MAEGKDIETNKEAKYMVKTHSEPQRDFEERVSRAREAYIDLMDNTKREAFDMKGWDYMQDVKMRMQWAEQKWGFKATQVPDLDV